ncbi:MAG: transketolase [Selenomonadaceae bacterium]|nr:transketolase [Selenomonadaceae bacterium]
MDKLTVDAIRVLSADAIEKAKSGHPGLPLGAASMAFELFARHLNHSAKDANWKNRDRFILSAGHGSMLLYSLLHFFGYGVTIDDIKNFRQLGSITPGHPEYGVTNGVEATTGPLGAGLGMAVGMAMAEAHLAAKFNVEGLNIVDHYTYALCGDGCMMEGISSEAMSLAGTLGLSKLIILYDSNKISIEGSTDLTFTEDVAARVRAFGFQTIDVPDGNDLKAIGEAIEAAKADKERPSFITVHTEIGYGCPKKQGKASSHGEPLGEDNVRELKEFLGWNPDEHFVIPQKVYDYCGKLAKRGEDLRIAWEKKFEEYSEKFPEKRALWDKYHGDIDVKEIINDAEIWKRRGKPVATRSVSGDILQRIKDIVPNLMGGSADLGPSNKTVMKDAGDFSKTNFLGRNIHFGVREMAMGAVANGLMLHGGIRSYAGTFFVFSDYLKPMVRLAAIMKLPITYVFTHDSIGVGEDGPTHEPIEHLSMYRAIPNLVVFRPAEEVETAVGWQLAMESKTKPTVLVLTRQNTPQIEGASREAINGAYVISPEKEKIDGILIASGSEVALAIESQKLLWDKGVDTRVVSMPSMEIFLAKDKAYREKILPSEIITRVVIEAGANFGWGCFSGIEGVVIAMESFGASAPSDMLFKHFGFTKEHIAEVMTNLIERLKSTSKNSNLI